MSNFTDTQPSISSLEENLMRVEKLLQASDVRPADFELRDRLVRRIQEAMAVNAA